MAVDGERLFLVIMDCSMALFALLYAFPNVPARFVVPEREGNEEDIEEWFAVVTGNGLRLALEALLRNAPVLSHCHASDGPPLTLEDFGDPDRMDVVLRLGLNDEDHEEPPVVARQLMSTTCAVLQALRLLTETSQAAPLGGTVGSTLTRENLVRLYTRHGLLSPGWHLPASRTVTVTGGQQRPPELLPFCDRLSSAWLQPYLAGRPDFFRLAPPTP